METIVVKMLMLVDVCLLKIIDRRLNKHADVIQPANTLCSWVRDFIDRYKKIWKGRLTPKKLNNRKLNNSLLIFQF